MCQIVVVFDFDRTIIDGDSDNWVVTQMGLTPLFQQLISTMPWNSLMVCIEPLQNRMMEELHLQEKTIEDIAQCLKQMPLDSHIISAVKAAHSMGCDVRLISDANQFFIETILKQHQLLDYFTEIITNPTQLAPLTDSFSPEVTQQYFVKPFNLQSLTEVIVVLPLIDSSIVKGMILERIQAKADENGKKTFIYLGDGGGDYCPSLRLGRDDHVMPRKGFPLWDRIQSNPSLVQAKIHEWSSAEQLERILIPLISGVPIDGSKPNCTSRASSLTDSSVQNNIISTVE
ncbi:hypothetical protein Cgig2_016720 [Carnegiea gigantea]|uniref:Uncharacterized protein n=1 Tax=Carnegiea gigantea TaxID=171969 RepID=A0A9Q1L093_9CARY|nr:hypothetical protein Cgig2_016720 [Carnegiea gigantea]